MKILSLFNGISCGMLACVRGGLSVDRYVSYEIDKYANQITQKNYPDIEINYDVVGADFTQYKGFDVVMGGFPCQDLSIAQKNRQGLEGKRSGLFWELVRAIKEVNPRYFLVENNYGMPKEAVKIITETLGVEPIMINSALVSAQNRKRYYWTNIPDIKQPADKGILLKDILQEEVDNRYFFTEKGYHHLHKIKIRSDARKLDFRPAPAAPPFETKVNCLDANYFKGADGKRTMVAIPICVAQRGRYTEQGETQQQLESRTDNKTNAITTVTKDNLILAPIRLGQIGNTGEQAQRIYSVNGKSVVLSANGGGQGAKTGLYKIDLPDGEYAIRKLTPIECERLQTLPDNYTAGISNTQRYRCLGNGWTVDVIAHILKNFKTKGGN